MKFRKKPVIIEAFKYDGDLKDRNGLFYVPFWAQEPYKKRHYVLRRRNL